MDNIPYSLALRIVRICSLEEDREEGLEELRELLLARSYRPGLVDTAISRARAIPRGVALQPRATHQQTRRPIHVVTYDPRLPQVQQIHNKHWRSMKVLDPRMSEVFPEPPMVAYRRQKNVKDFLVRSKIPPKPKHQPKRKNNGMKRCGKSCPACPFIKEGKFIKKHKNNWEIHGNLNCETKNLVYLIECNKETCKLRYVGETEKSLKERLSNHTQKIKTIIPTTATGEHFNEPGHDLSNMTITIIEKIKNQDLNYRREREKFHIKQFNTFYKGLNRQL